MRRAPAAMAMAMAIACATAASAAAQPGQTPPGTQPPPPPPGWGAQPYAAPGYHLLGEEERDLLLRGEIGEGAHIAGGLVGTFFGFGLGHLVQGRFGDKGWIFMAGEAAAVTIVVIGLANCMGDSFDEGANDCEDFSGWLAVGTIAAAGFRIWELIDVWAGPGAHNARVREIRRRAGLPPYALFAAPPFGRGDAGGVAGLTLRF